MGKLQDKIIKAVKKLKEKTVKTNVPGEGCPIIISENDLCCYLFKELYNPKKYSIKTEVDVNADEKMRYLFNWDNIPGTDSKKFLDFLKDDFGLCWAKNAQITKSDDHKIVTVKDGENSREIKQNDKGNRIIIPDGNNEYKYSLNKNKEVYDNKIRSDLVIFNKSESTYKLKFGNPDEWDCEHYLAIMELKVNWSPKDTKEDIESDLWALSKLKENVLSKLKGKPLSESYYMIMFDFWGNYKEEELKELKSQYDGIYLIYADIKKDKIYISPEF